MAGLYVSYLASKQGLKVLAFEKNLQSGDLLTASHGETRGWVYDCEDDEIYSSLNKLKELEKEGST